MNNPATRFARDGVTKPYTSKMKFMTRQHDVYDLLSVLLNQPRRVVGCCAELVQYFTRWDEWKRKTQRSPWIYKPLHHIEADLRAYSIRVIRYAISLLMRLGILERRNNPGSRLDRVYQYRIHLNKLKTTDPAGDKSDSTMKPPSDSSLAEAPCDTLCQEDPDDLFLAEAPCGTLFQEDCDTLCQEDPEDLFLLEAPCDTLCQGELVSNELPSNKLSSNDTIQCKPFSATSAETLVVDDFTPLAHSSDQAKNSSASGVQNIDPKNQYKLNRSISLSKCESKQKEKVSVNYVVIVTNPSLGEPLSNFIANNSQKVPQDDLAQSKTNNFVKEEHRSQDRTEAIEDKSSAAASVEFVEKPIKSKGFNPRQTRPRYELRGFNSQQEKDGFYQALVELGKQKTQVLSPVGWANNIIKDINAGGLCEYLFEYRRGEPLGMCEKQEWEIAPGQVYPRFLRFLSCRLKTDQMSGEQSIAAAHKALRDKGEAYQLWESFKRTIVNFADQWERDKALGVSGAYVPPELLADADVTLLDAAEAMQLLQSNSVQSNESPELMPPVPPEVLVSAEASESDICTTHEREKNLHRLAQIERMREFLKSGNSVKVTIARKWVGSNLDIVEPIQEHGVIVDVLVTDASISEPPPARAHLKVGDVCYYDGKDYSWVLVCKRYRLTVKAISGEMATVSAPNWYVTQEIPLADLRLIE